MRIVALFIAIIFFGAGSAQEPSHYFFGDDELATVSIYDIIQDHYNNYWLATDEGLIRYDGYTYTHISCSEIKSQSVFNLRINSKGHIYCNNLNNQVFRVVNSKMELFYTIPEDNRHPNTFLDLGSNDNVYIQSADLTIIHNDKSTQRIKHDLDFRQSRISMHVLDDGTCISSSFKDLLIVKNGQSKKYRLTVESDSTQTLALNAWISNDDGIYAIDQNTHSIYKLDTASIRFTLVRKLSDKLKGAAIRVYQSNGVYWIAGNKNGVYLYDGKWSPLFNGEIVLKEHFISDVYTDEAGTTLLGTFGDGLIIVPTLDDINIHIPTGEIHQICGDGDSVIYIGNSLGEIYAYNQINQNISLLYKPEKQKPIEFMAYWNKQNTLFFTSNKGFVQYQFKLPKPEIIEHNHALKHMAFDRDYALAALNTGVLKINPNDKASNDYKNYLSKGRSYGVCISDKIYAILSSGLVELTDTGPVNIMHKGESIFATSIIHHNDLEYVSTLHDGVYVLKNGELFKQYPMASPAHQLKVFNGTIYALSGNDLFVLTEEDRFSPIESIASASRNEIGDFLEMNGRFYYSVDNVLCSFSLESFKEASEVKILGVDVLVNGKSNLKTTLGHEDNEIEFVVKSPTIKYQNQTSIKYKLEGYDRDWEYADYHENVLSYKKLPPGKYTMRIVTSVSGLESDEWTYSFIISPPYYKQAWFYILIGALVLSIVIAIYIIRVRQVRRKSQAELNQQKMRTDLLEMELKALRSQMNPHFIFNSLNSIQNLILKEDIDNSYDYLVLFAKLVRATLNYSDLSFIPINEEIEFLETYLSLEKLRFKDDFTYEISYEGDDSINVPPLILQPFVENAIVHGLMHSSKQKKLSIRIHLDDKLHCIIEDNGVGRKRSKEINERRNSNHKSFAINAMKQRLELMNKHFGNTDGNYAIHDVMEGDEVVGTRVELSLPVKFNY